MDDPLLRRIERTAVAACLVMAGLALLAFGWRAALGVIGGGVLAAVSYASIASGVSALTAALARISPQGGVAREGGTDPEAESRARRRPGAGWRAMAKVVFRYALLVALAYVMIARLRPHPVAVLAGLSSVVVAAGIEALRIVVKKP